MDLSKLTPAPFEVVSIDGAHIQAAFEGCAGLCVQQVDEHGGHVAFLFEDNRDTAEFFVMARNAFDGDQAALAWWEANRVRRSDEKTA